MGLWLSRSYNNLAWFSQWLGLLLLSAFDSVLSPTDTYEQVGDTSHTEKRLSVGN
jgi:hypothetical protein